MQREDLCHTAQCGSNPLSVVLCRNAFRTAAQRDQNLGQERASFSRAQRLHSISSAVMGVMACARRIWSAEHSLRPTYFTLPSSTSSCRNGAFPIQTKGFLNRRLGKTSLISTTMPSVA